MDAEGIKKRINELMQKKDYEMVWKTLEENQEVYSNEFAVCQWLFKAYVQERDSNQCTVFEKAGSFEKLIERFTKLKFYLRRIDFGVIDDNVMDEILQFLALNRVSSYELLVVADCSVINKERVLQAITDRVT